MGELTMKKIIILSLMGLGLLCACNREAESLQFAKGGKSITAVLPETKSFLGEKDGTSYPNYWAAGDAINVNGVVSDPLDASFDGKSQAEFTIASATAPLNAVYPASAVSAYADGAAAISLPATQNYVAGSYDPSAYVMIAHSETEATLAFAPVMSLFKFVPSGSVNIASIKFIASSSKPVSGAFTTDFSGLTGAEGASNVVTLNMPEGGIAPGTPVIMAIPAGDYTDGIGVVFTDVDGGIMARRASPSKPYEAGKMYSTEIDYEAAILYCEAETITSSSVVLTWSSVNPEDNINRAFDLMVYSDAGCNNLVETLSIPANADCWAAASKNWHLHFVIGGLSQGTQYWFKVKDKTDNSVSEACTATTTDFTVVPIPTADISSTGVVYAEDFSEFAWGWDRTHEAGGYLPVDQSSLSNHNTEGATFVRSETAETTGMRATSLDAALSASRLDGWLSEGNTYYMPGYLKLGSSNSYGFVLTPKFLIAEGKEATVNVTIKGSRFGEEESETWMLCVVSKDGKKGPRQSDFAWPDETNPELYKEIEFANIGSDWKTVTVEGFKMSRGDCIAFGRTKGGSNSTARVFLSEISVEVTALTEVTPTLTASVSRATSSSIIFTWDGSPDDAYTATLYSDAACTQTVASFEFPAGDACWRSKEPKYVIGGLNPNTNYWFKVSDTTHGIESEVISGKTENFPITQMPASITGTGIALAENFGELRWQSDMVLDAAGFVPSNTDSFSSTEVANYVAGNSNSGEKKYSTVTAPLAASRLKNWAVDSNVYYHCGYLKMGTASGKGWIVTPQFTVPEGKKAIVTVTLTATRYNNSQETEWAVAVLNETETNMKTDYTCSFDWPSASTDLNYRLVTLSKVMDWETVTVSGLEVYPGDRIAFGPKNGCSGSKARVMVDDITVEVTSLKDAVTTPIVASALEITSSTLSFTWNEKGDQAHDANLKYTATLYSDASCSTEVESRTFAAGQGSSLWRDKYPKFIFAGLSENTQYYFRVSDGDGQLSNVVAVKTSAFTVKEMPASISDTGLAFAEDFSLFVWDFEYGQGCVGMQAPDSPTLYNTFGTAPIAFSESTGNYQMFTSSAFSGSRLNKWARDANTDARVMVHPGSVTLGTNAVNQKSWILTPEFPIASGMVATVTVSITAHKGLASATGDYAVGILNNSHNSGANGGGTNMQDANTSDFSWPNDRTSEIYNNFTVANDVEWQTFTYTDMKLRAGDRIVVGARAGYSYSSKICCLTLSDITVTVTAISNE